MSKSLRAVSQYIEAYYDQCAITATVLWAIMHLYFSYHRGQWPDELPKFDAMNGGHLQGLQPSEIFLGYLSKWLIGWSTPEEVWGRLPSIIFGSFTVWLTFSMRLRFLILPLLFSASMTTFATQFSPYAALIFGGALTFKLLWEEKKPTPFENFLVWYGIIFGHIYGICFLTMALLLRRDLKKIIISLLYLIAILTCYLWLDAHRLENKTTLSFAPFTTVFYALGNPHKASYFLLPFVGLGTYVLFQKNRSLFIKTMLFFIATIAVPMVVAYKEHYYHTRQSVGGMFGFLALAAIGLDWSVQKFKNVKIIQPTLWSLSTYFAIGPWFAFVLGIPPFVDQPLHKFHHIVSQVVHAGEPHILWADPSTAGPAIKYFNRYLGPHKTLDVIHPYGFYIEKFCWPSTCLYIVMDNELNRDGYNVVHKDSRFAQLLNSGNPAIFSTIVYSFQNFSLPTSVNRMRTW